MQGRETEYSQFLILAFDYVGVLSDLAVFLPAFPVAPGFCQLFILARMMVHLVIGSTPKLNVLSTV